MASVAVMMLLFTTVYASNSQKIDAILNSINITVNGEQVAKSGESYTLSNGTKVPYSISYAGTTYLPMRKVAELLNKDVAYANGTANIKDKEGAEYSAPIAMVPSLSFDADGTPEFYVGICNLTDKDIKGFTCALFCYDKNWKPVIVTGYNNNIVTFGDEDTLIKGNEDVAIYVPLDNAKGTVYYEQAVIDVTFADGSTWARP